MGVRLPSAYQEVEYLQSDGHQYFYSDIDIQDGLTVDSVQSYNTTGDMYLFGGNTANGRSTFNGGYRRQIEAGYPSGYYLTGSGLDKTNNTVYHIVITHANGTITVYLDGNLVKNTSGLASIEADGSKCAVFGNRPAAGGEPNYKYKGRVYSLKVSKNGTMLADYVPCYRKSDDEIGMYDLVLQKFYSNEGTGVFLKGADVIDSISPWLVARRRLLMRKPKLDTSPRIAQYGYGLSRSNTGITKVEANCYTEWYDVDPVATYQRTMTGSGVASGGANGYCFQTKSETGGNWDYWPNRKYLHANSISIRFTLITSEIDNAYVYCASGGQIFFAGKNTPYYGYTNINDMPTGT